MDNALPKEPTGPTIAEMQEGGAFGRLVNRIGNVSAALAGVAIIVILAMVCLEVVLRQFRISLLVVDEICGYLNAAAVFLGLAYTLREGGFIRVEIVYDRMKGALKQAVRWLIVISATVYTALLLYFTAIHVVYLYERDVRAVSVIETPEWLPQSVAIAGLAILLLQLVAFIAARARNIP